MNITNPTNFGIPGLTLTTSNAEGTGNAIRTGASILTYDTTAATAVAASASAGDTATAARRNHVHSGVGGAGTVVDEAITRFNGTSGSSLQGYSSLSPTISDAGIISLTSGALKFPATAIASANANTLDDYEEGVWTPTLLDAPEGNPAGVGSRVGQYTKIGTQVFLSWTFAANSISGMTDTNTAVIAGLPFTPRGTSNLTQVGISLSYGLSLSAVGAVVLQAVAGTAAFNIACYDTTAGTSEVSVAEFSASGTMRASISYPI